MTHPASPFVLPVMMATQRALRLLVAARGTPDDPVYFDEGEPVPQWIELTFPGYVKATFVQDVETFWLDGWQHVYPLWRAGYSVEFVNDSGRHGWVNGAPTHVHWEPRPGRPRRKAEVPTRLELGSA